MTLQDIIQLTPNTPVVLEHKNPRTAVIEYKFIGFKRYGAYLNWREFLYLNEIDTSLIKVKDLSVTSYGALKVRY